MRPQRGSYFTTYELGDGMSLSIGKPDKAFAPITLIDKDGDRMAVTMYQLLTAISAVYNYTKGLIP